MTKHPMNPNWTSVKFGEVVRLSTDRIADPVAAGIERYVGLEHIDPEDLRLRRWGQVADGITFTNQFRPGQVLFGKRRAYLRKVAVADFEGVCSSDIYVFETQDPNRLLPELLPFICQTEGFLGHAVDTSAGSISPRTNWTNLAEYRFALPPLDEQLKLAKVFWTAEAAKQSLDSVIRAASQLLDSVRNHLVKASAPNDFHVIGDVAKLAIDRHPVLNSGGYHIVGVYSFGRGLLSHGTRMGAETKYKYLHRVHEGQLVLSKLKAWEGAVAVAEPQHDLTYVSPEYPTFELKRDLISPGYMQLVCESSWFWRNITSLSQGTAERRARINPSDFLKVPVHIPPLEEQQSIVNRIELMKQSMDLCEIRLLDTTELKRSLLSDSLKQQLMSS